MRKPSAYRYRVHSSACQLSADNGYIIEAYAKQKARLSVSFAFKYNAAKARSENRDLVATKKVYKKIGRIPIWPVNVPVKTWDEIQPGGNWTMTREGTVEYGNKRLSSENELSEIAAVIKMLSGLLSFLTSVKAFYEMRPGKSDNKLDFELPHFKLELACESKEEPAQPTVSHLGQLKLSFEPLLSASISIDIIDWLAVCYGSPAFAAFLSMAREAASDMGNEKFGGKVELGILLTMEGQLATVNREGATTPLCVDYTASYAQDANGETVDNSRYEAKGELTGQLAFELKGYAEVEGHAKFTWLDVQASAGILAYIRTNMGVSINFDVKQQADGLDTRLGGQLFFDGLIVYYSIYAEVDVSVDAKTDDLPEEKVDGSGDISVPGAGANDSSAKPTKEEKFENEITLIPGFAWPNRQASLALQDVFANESSVDIKTVNDK